MREWPSHRCCEKGLSYQEFGKNPVKNKIIKVNLFIRRLTAAGFWIVVCVVWFRSQQ
jgi:hypothetical protein